MRNSMVQKSLGASDIPKLQIGGRVRSLPREENLINTEGGSLVTHTNELRRSTKNAEVRQLTEQLINFGKRGNRPSANMLPRPVNFTTSEINVNITGRDDSNDSRGQ